MKEGYFQLKLAELNEKITAIEQLVKFEESKLQLIQEKVGEYKEVIKKLKHIDEFKSEMLAAIRKENEQMLTDQVNQVSQRLSKVVDDVVKERADTITETVALLQQREQDLGEQAALVEQHAKDLVYLMEHTDILMMKLVNRDVLSGHDVDELHRRATKKAQGTKVDK